VHEFTFRDAQVFPNRDSALHYHRLRLGREGNKLMLLKVFLPPGTELVCA